MTCDPILDPLAFMFPAERGFVQGSAISPLLWIVFYDMVICELDGRRVGSSATADTGVGNGGGGGLITFADDTTIVAATLAALQREADEVMRVFRAVCLETAPQKSIHVPLMYKREGDGIRERWLSQEVLGVRENQLRLNGVAVPFLEADEGFRFLGYHLDLMGDYGDQQDRLRVTIDDFGAKLARARISKGMVMYIVEAVLIPRVLYPMTVIPFTPDHIRHLESRALRWILPKIGLTRTFARDLVGADLDWGGLGWDRRTGRVAVARSALAAR